MAAQAQRGKPGASIRCWSSVERDRLPCWWATRTPYDTYFEGAKFVHFLIGPATVALAVPLCSQKVNGRLLAAVAADRRGAAAWARSWRSCRPWASRGCSAGSHELLMSLAPKSATMPIAMGVSEKIGGLPSLAAVAVAITGIARRDHGDGPAEPVAHQESPRCAASRSASRRMPSAPRARSRSNETAGAFSALAMGLNGIATALLVPLVVKLAGGLEAQGAFGLSLACPELVEGRSRGASTGSA